MRNQTKNRRRTLARHGQQKSPGVLGQLARLIGIGLAVVLVSVVGVAGYFYGDFSATVTANAVELEGQESVPPNISEYKGGFNILLVGLDVCEQDYEKLFPGRCTKAQDRASANNDVNLLIHVSDEPRRVTAVSFPRDLMIKIPSCTNRNGDETSELRKESLNVAYSRGGLNCVAKTITELSGQEIQYAASVTFGGVIDITDAIGGVDVCLASPIKDSHTMIDQPAGIWNVSGFSALQFLRTRHGVGDESDLDRIDNQQQYMSNLAKKLLSSEVLGDVPTMLRLVNAALGNVEPSESLNNPMTLVQMGLALKGLSYDDVVFLQYPSLVDPDNPKAKVIPNPTAAQQMWEAIASNQQLEVTHVATGNEGVVAADPPSAEPDGTAAGPTAPTDGSDTANPAPADGVAELPSAVKGTTAGQNVCSNGNVRK